jgi:hypothetical protein
MRKRVPRLLGNVDLVRRELQAAVFHARAQGQVQPLSRALIDGPARRGPHRRLRLPSGASGRRLLNQDHMPIDCGRLNLRRAAVTRRSRV